MAKKSTASSWLKAFEDADVEVTSARDSMQVKGWLDSGNYALNWAVSGQLLRGYPLGRSCEIFGDPATGKSFLAARAIAMAQMAGGVALLDDTEGAYSAEHSAKLGIDVDALAMANSHTVKEHLAITKSFVAQFTKLGLKGPGIEVCDSLAQLSTEHELEVGLDKRDMTKAAELKAFYRIMGAELNALPVLHLATNHTIAAIGSMFESRTTPGGGGPKFMASVRIDLRATSKIKAGAEVIGAICRAVVVKNRFTAPFKEVRLAVPFNREISRTSGLVFLLTALGVLEERGNFLFYGSEKIGRANKSKDKFLAADEVGETLLDTAPDILERTDALIASGQLQSVSAGASVAVGADEDDEEEGGE